MSFSKYFKYMLWIIREPPVMWFPPKIATPYCSANTCGANKSLVCVEAEVNFKVKHAALLSNRQRQRWWKNDNWQNRKLCRSPNSVGIEIGSPLWQNLRNLSRNCIRMIAIKEYKDPTFRRRWLFRSDKCDSCHNGSCRGKAVIFKAFLTPKTKYVSNERASVGE